MTNVCTNYPWGKWFCQKNGCADLKLRRSVAAQDNIAVTRRSCMEVHVKNFFASWTSSRTWRKASKTCLLGPEFVRFNIAITRNFDFCYLPYFESAGNLGPTSGWVFNYCSQELVSAGKALVFELRVCLSRDGLFPSGSGVVWTQR